MRSSSHPAGSPEKNGSRKTTYYESLAHLLVLLSLLVGFGLSSIPICAEANPVHPTWPGPGQLFVGTCYQPVDRSPHPLVGFL